jgi:nickel transport system ATP-binding protein
MKELLKVSNLCVGLKGQTCPIVKNISFALQEGSALAVVGESGSGKTMTCKSVMQLLNPKTFEVSGRIRYRNTDILTMDEKGIRALCGSKIAMIVQNPMTAFDPTTKIGAQVVETLMVHRRIRKRDAYASGILALEKMNLPRCEQLMNSYPYTLSGGMLQRIIIALSMINEPEIIIADEATTALDVKNQNMVLKELEKMKGRGIALLLVTHDFGVAAKLADDVIVMREGEIIERGTVYDIFESPREDYTKELLKASILTRGNCID